MAKTKVSPLERATDELGRKIGREDLYKVATMVDLKNGTHHGYLRVEHRAAQRSVERLQAKILLLKGMKTAPTSMDRAEVRLIAEKLRAVGGKFTGNPEEAYRRARARNLGTDWLAAAARKAPGALVKLWEGGIKSAELQAAIRLAGTLRHIHADG